MLLIIVYSKSPKRPIEQTTKNNFQIFSRFCDFSLHYYLLYKMSNVRMLLVAINIFK